MQGAPQNVLITSISRKVPMIEAVRDALGRVCPGGKIYGADSWEECVGRFFVDHFWHQPLSTELTLEEVDYYCVRNRIGWIVPSRDEELGKYAGWREGLAAAGVGVMVGDPSGVRICRDKLEFTERLQSVPEVLKAYLSPKKKLGCRWVVKERFGAGSSKIELDLSLTEAEEMALLFLDPLFQRFVEGSEYSIDVYCSGSGEVWGCVVRSRDLVLGGEAQVTTVVRHEALEELCLRAAAKLKLRYHAVFQAIQEPSGKLHLIECNPRFGGASTLSLRAGLDSFGWFLRETRQERFHPDAFVRGEPGLRLIRYPADRFESVSGNTRLPIAQLDCQG